jgi:hypothetical protein
MLHGRAHRGSAKTGRGITLSARATQWTTDRGVGFLSAALTVLVLSTLASASELKGMVINGSTRKPVVGDEVMLLTLSHEGMSEGASTKTDSAGRFKLSVPDPQETHLVRVTHQGVTYHKMVEPDLKPLAVQVYNAIDKLDGVSAIMDVERFEAKNDTLELKQLITVRNVSKPPRTLTAEHALEIHLPPEAQIQSGLVQIEDGQPLKQKPIPGEQKGQYYFQSPLRPGDTRFAVVYRLPYTGEALIEPKARNPLERFVVMLPRSMKFEPRNAGIFQSIPNISPDNVQGTAPVRPEQVLAFRISGTGTLEELQGSRQAQKGDTAQRDLPGGGLGVHIDAPDPLHEQRWLIFGALVVLLGVGAMWAISRPLLSQLTEHRSAPNRLKVKKSRDQETRIAMTKRQKRRARVSQKCSR